MRQFQFAYQNEDKFVNSLRKINQWRKSAVSSTVFFQIYTSKLNRPKIETLCAMIEREMPDAFYMGCSAFGNIMMGNFTTDEITVVCSVFEYFTTKIKILQYPLTGESAQHVTSELIKEVKDAPWCKCVMTYATMRGMSMTDFCDGLKDLPEDVQFFGGGAFNFDINSEYACVFSSADKISDHAVSFALMGGEDFNVTSTYITGWKPLGRELLVTNAEGPKLLELDGKPAYEVYYKYLRIKNDEDFFNNTLEFPFFYEHNGINLLRAPVSSNRDGSLNMTADMEKNVKARIAYGDPWTILVNVNDEALKLRNFIPEAISVFSCAARRTYWGDDEVSKETLPFQSIAPTSGFYTSGEFLRTNGMVNQHNVTLVIAAMREGKRDMDSMRNVETNERIMSGKVSMINRLATFIQAATVELEEANRQLKIAAVTDGLTGVYNRREIQNRINDTIEETAALNAEGSADGTLKVNSLIMLDIDNFKSVNDTYGHKEGDEVLQKLAAMMLEVVGRIAPEGSVGRWGGEEFMILLPGTDESGAKDLAELLRVNFSIIKFTTAPNQTVSVGVTEVKSTESPDDACMRVDKALYEGKHSGKNKVVVL
ncbi:MAG: diguanylate cyclase [Lachnospiraceae bacterium]|nr:diguanylate cyclase [Lachnospiraceae bacterium]